MMLCRFVWSLTISTTPTHQSSRLRRGLPQPVGSGAPLGSATPMVANQGIAAECFMQGAHHRVGRRQPDGIIWLH